MQGLPLRAQILYLRGIRRYMDYRSRISGGPQRRISLGMLAEISQELVNRQIQPKTSKDGIRASIAQLKRAGLLERIPDADFLVFFLPLADADKYPVELAATGKSALHNHPTSAPPAVTPDHTGGAGMPDSGLRAAPPVGLVSVLAANHPTHQLTGNPETPAMSLVGVTELSQPDRVTPDKVTPDKVTPDRVTPDKVPYQAIIDLYHQLLPQLPPVYKLNSERRRRIKALWEDELEDLSSWGHYFRHIARSDFLMGRTLARDGRQFRASLDFIIHPSKFIKIAEEHYHVKKVQTSAR